MHMLDKPIIKYMYFTLLKHAITNTVAFVIISEYLKKSKSCTQNIQSKYYQTQTH